MIPIARLNVGEEEAAAAADVVRSGWLTQGRRGPEFEEAVAGYVGARHAIATNSCTTALHLAFLAAGVTAGDEVICPSFSFIATANSILYAGATPVFVDIDPRTYNLDPSLVEAAITDRTVAILAVSQIGLAADIPALRAIAERRGLALIEDAAPSLGAMIGSRHLGALSDLTCFSFDARKILTTGEGGMITTDSEAMARRLRMLRAHAASVPTEVRHAAAGVLIESYPELGFNYKMTEMQAAIGVVQMRRLDAVVAERRRLAGRYRTLLSGESRLELPWEPPGYRHVYQSYCVRLADGIPRHQVMSALAQAGVATRRIMAIHVEPLYRRLLPGVSLPETEKATDTTLLLPMFVGLTNEEQETVVTALREALDTCGAKAARDVDSAPAALAGGGLR